MVAFDNDITSSNGKLSGFVVLNKISFESYRKKKVNNILRNCYGFTVFILLQLFITICKILWLQFHHILLILIFKWIIIVLLSGTQVSIVEKLLTLEHHNGLKWLKKLQYVELL